MMYTAAERDDDSHRCIWMSTDQEKPCKFAIVRLTDSFTEKFVPLNAKSQVPSGSTPQDPWKQKKKKNRGRSTFVWVDATRVYSNDGIHSRFL